MTYFDKLRMNGVMKLRMNGVIKLRMSGIKKRTDL